MATHKELSNFTHRELSQYTHLQLQIYQLKASLTPNNSDIPLPPTTIMNIENVYIQYPELPKTKKFTLSSLVESLESGLKLGKLVLPGLEKIVELIRDTIL